MDPEAAAVVEALQSQLRELKSRLSVESRRLANSRHLAESFERAALASQLQATEAEARAQRAEATLRYYRETHEVKERGRKITKLATSIGEEGDELQAAEGLVRTCSADPILSHPIAGLAKRRELKKLVARVEFITHRFESEKALLKRLVDLEENQVALWLAASDDDPEGLDRAVRRGGSVNSADKHGFNALHYGCSRGYVRVVGACLEHGADLSSEYGLHTPLILAARHGHVAVVRLLLRAGVDVDGVDSAGQTALHAAAEAGHRPVLEALLDEGGAHVDPLDSHGSTPLHVGVKNLRHFAVTTLLARGADARWKDLHGRTTLEIIPPLPPAVRGVANLADAERLVVETQERSEIRKLISAHFRLTENDRDALAAAMREQAAGSSALDADVLSVAGSLEPSVTSTLTGMTKRTFPSANIHLDRSQQRTLTRKAKGEGYLERRPPASSVVSGITGSGDGREAE